MSSALFLGVFLIKHRVELLLSFPFLAILFAWYLHIGVQADSPAQYSERLYRQHGFMVYIGCFVGLVAVLLYVDVPALHYFLENAFMAQ